MKKYDLMTISDIEDLSQKSCINMYKDYVNPGIATYLKVLGLERTRIIRSEGMFLYTKDGREILDLSGGMSVLNHGHNHPRILKVRREFNEQRRLEICKAFISQYQAVLARNLAQIFPGDLHYSFFCNSGAEANEGALKMALLFQAGKRDKIVYTDLGYHGKTFATMSVSGEASKPYSKLFKQLDGCMEVPYGDINAFRKLIQERKQKCGKHDIAAIILEAIKGDIVVRPPKGYLRELSEICRREEILLIDDEVFTGFGRTGKMFAFEHENIEPDIVTFSKSLGGGKASIAGYIAKKHIFKKTYAPLKRCTVHTTTFGGLGEECVTAIEALNIINDEGLIDNAKQLGEYLLSGMRRLKDKYPNYIKEVRGVGLLCIFELFSTSEIFDSKVLKMIPNVDESLEGLFPALIVSELFKTKDILMYTGCRMDNLFVNPSLIIKKEQIDMFLNALDEVFQKNLYALGMKLAHNYCHI